MVNRPYFAFLFASLPVLYLHAVNIRQVHTLAAWRLLAGSVLVALPFYLVSLRLPIGKISPWLNYAGLAAVLFAFANILVVGLPRDLHVQNINTRIHGKGEDVYFIVLDSFTSPALLMDRFCYDASGFVTSLEDLGFRVGECSSPAGLTELSLSIYLSGSDKPGWEAIRHSDLREHLEAEGYQTWAFSSGWVWTEIMDADRYIAPPYGPLSEFEIYALGLTGIFHLDPVHGDMTRSRTLTILEHLADAAHDPGAQFVFAHIVQPHPPFVFYADGRARDGALLLNPEYTGPHGEAIEYLPELYDIGYLAQVEYISTAVLFPLSEIIQSSPESTIILTGDHGPWYSRTDAESRLVLCATYGLQALEAREAVLEIIGR